jgi:hypothetical protein
MVRKAKTGIRKENRGIQKEKKEKSVKVISFSGFCCWRSWFIMEEVGSYTRIKIEKIGTSKNNQREYLTSLSKRKKK